MIDFVELRLYSNYSATSYELLPLYSSLSFDVKYNDIGAIEFEYPLAEARIANLKDQSLIGAAVGFSNGTTREVERFIIEGTDDDKVSDDTRMMKVSGRATFGTYMEDATVYPSNWPTTSPTGHEFVNNTVGTIMRTLILRAKNRGCFPFLDETSFSGTSDSTGQAWGAAHSQNYATGTSYLQVLKDFMDLGYVDGWMEGNSLKLRNGGARGLHINIGTVELRPAHNVSEMVTTTKSEESITTVLMEGEEGTAVERHRAAFQTTLGRRRERYVQSGGIADAGVLTLLADAELELYARIPTEETLGVSNYGLTPFVDFDIADWVWVRYDTAEDAVERRVRQIAVAVDEAGTVTLGLTLNSILYEGDVALKRRMDQYTGKGGTYGSTINTNIDVTRPAAPTGASVTAGNYWDPKTRTYTGAFVVNWIAPTLNVDGTALDDLSHYEVVWRYQGDTEWSGTLQTGGTETTLGHSPATPGRVVQVMVRAVDKNENVSDWSAVGSATVPADVTPPPKPSTPVLNSRLGTIRAYWDGLTSQGAAMPEDLWYVSVHIGPNSSFTPTDANRVATMDRAGAVIAGTDLLFNTTHWIRLVAYDVSNNASVPSTAASVVVQALVATDIIGKVLNGANIVDGSITASDSIIGNTITGGLIQSLAINTGHLAANAVTTPKVAAGTITADKISVGSRGISVLANSWFEDAVLDANGEDTGVPTAWTVLYSSGTTTLSFAPTPISGNRSLRVTSTGTPTIGQNIASGFIPVAAGQKWYLTATFRPEAAVAAGKRFFIRFMTSTNRAGGPSPNALPGAEVTWATISRAGPFAAGAEVKVEGTFTVPADHRRANVSFVWDSSMGSVSPFVVDVDSVELYPAVEDVNITSIGPGKIVTGTLQALVRIIAGTDGGARAEMTGTGFRAYNGSNQQMFSVESSGGDTYVGNPNGIHMQMGAYANWWNGNISSAMLKFKYTGSGWGEGNLFANYWTDGGLNYAALRLQSPYVGDPYANAAYLDVRSRSSDGASFAYIRAMEFQITANTMIMGSADGSSNDFRAVHANGFQFSDFSQTSRLRLQPQAGRFLVRAAQSDGTTQTLTLQGTDILQSFGGVELWTYQPSANFGFGHFSRNVALLWGSDRLRVVSWNDGAWQPIAASSFVVNSDPRLKSNAVKVETGALKALKAIGVYDYDMEGILPRQSPKKALTAKASRAEGEEEPQRVIKSQRARGVMAHELAKVLPDAVNEDEEGNLSVSLYDLLATAVAAIKELAEEVDALKAVRTK